MRILYLFCPTKVVFPMRITCRVSFFFFVGLLIKFVKWEDLEYCNGLKLDWLFLGRFKAFSRLFV